MHGKIPQPVAEKRNDRFARRPKAEKAARPAPARRAGGRVQAVPRFASPILAGIQALVNQKQGARQGKPNAVYYKLAATEYGATGSASCNSTNGNTVGSTCVFYDVTQGDMDVNCTGTHNCYQPSRTNGVLSTSSTSYLKACGTAIGWDFATGIGTVNATNLVNNWP
jgi:subtilase family serine protease